MEFLHADLVNVQSLKVCVYSERNRFDVTRQLHSSFNLAVLGLHSNSLYHKSVMGCKCGLIYTVQFDRLL